VKQQVPGSMLLLLLLLLALLGAPCARTQVTGAEELQRVMEQYDYSPALPSSPRTLETCKDSDASCCIELLYPRRGYQGDNSSAARMRRSEARLHFRVRGGGCVQEGGSSLRSRRQLRVLVDEADEAVSTDPELVMAVSETLSGSHHVTAMVEEEEEEGRRRRTVAEYRTDFVILQDIEILFPSDNYVFQHGSRVTFALAVSPTALERFCAGDFSDCKRDSPKATGISISLNGNVVSEIKMKDEDGDDGRRVYHVEVMDLPVELYELSVQLLHQDGDNKQLIGEVSFASFEVAECARHGRLCEEEEEEEGGREEKAMEVQEEELRKVEALTRLIASCPPHSPVCENSSHCSSHGVCVRGACLCEGDWIGVSCNHSLLHHRSFLPSPSSSSSRCQQSRWWLEGERRLRYELEELHSVGRCGAGGMRFHTRMHGLGAQVHYLSEGLTSAWRKGNALLLAGNSSRAVECGRRKMKGGHELARELYSCFLQPFSECPEEPHEDSTRHEPEPNSRYTGKEVQEVPKGSRFWWRMQTVSFLLRPSPALEAQLRLVKAALRLPPSYIAMHIRHGDSCMHATISSFRPKCVPFDVYLERAIEMSNLYNVKHVYLATDDPQVAAAASREQRLEFFQLDFDRSVLEGDWFLEFRSQLGLADAFEITQSALIDLFLLSQGNFFVGSFASHFSRLAFELMVARLGFFPPFASVDYPWCFHMLHKDEVPGYGPVNC